MISFTIFNASSMKEAFNNIYGLFNFNNPFINGSTLYYFKSYLIVLVIAIIGSTPLIKNIIDKLNKNEKIKNIINVFEPILLLVLLIVVTSYLIDNSYNPFLYFRF